MGGSASRAAGAAVAGGGACGAAAATVARLTRTSATMRAAVGNDIHTSEAAAGSRAERGCGVRRIARRNSSAQTAASAAAVRNAAPGKYTAAAGAEKRLKIWVKSGGPMMALRL